MCSIRTRWAACGLSLVMELRSANTGNFLALSFPLSLSRPKLLVPPFHAYDIYIPVRSNCNMSEPGACAGKSPSLQRLSAGVHTQ